MNVWYGRRTPSDHFTAMISDRPGQLLKKEVFVFWRKSRCQYALGRTEHILELKYTIDQGTRQSLSRATKPHLDSQEGSHYMYERVCMGIWAGLKVFAATF